MIGFRRLEGHDPEQRRYDRQFYVARTGTTELACLVVVLDRIDRRARVLQLESRVEGLLGCLFAHVSDQLQRDTGGDRLVLVVDVSSAALKLQTTLERLGFVPTVWYPGLVSSDSGREDAIQYTKLFNCQFEDSIYDVAAGKLDWAGARSIVERTQDLFRLAR